MYIGHDHSIIYCAGILNVLVNLTVYITICGILNVLVNLTVYITICGILNVLVNLTVYIPICFQYATLRMTWRS